jgi:hypothetical protein
MYKFYILLLFPILVFSQDTITKPQHSVISLDKVKVVYRGIDNPITVAVTNAKSYTVSGYGVFLNDDETYSIRPGVGLETKVYVEIILEDDSFVVEEHVYQIKGLPRPIPSLNDEFSTQGLLTFKLEELKKAELGIKFIDFIYGNFNPYVNQFSIKVPRNPTLTINGNIFTEEVLQLLKKARKKDIILISNIKGNYMVGNALHKPIIPFTFQIIK